MGATEVDSIVLEYFDGDKDKSDLWFNAKNPTLGGASPNEMIKTGRYPALLKLVRILVAEGL